jgi:hypothetical protein
MRLFLCFAAILFATAGAAFAQTALPEKGQLQPASATYSVAAGGGSVTIQVTRTLGTSGAVGCSYSTVNGSAVAGTDYTTVSGSLSWANGDGAAKSVSIPVTASGAGKSFSFRLSAPTGGAFLGVPATSPRTNHEGRVLGTTPAITNVEWNTTQADAIISTLQILPANNPWNEDIRSLPVLSNSTTMINNIGAGTKIALNRDMNYVFVPSNQAKKSVNLVDYPDESDPGPYPVPNNAPIEGYPVDDTRSLDNSQMDVGGLGGDRHCMVLDPSNGFFYEFWQMVRTSSYAWTASNDATFNLNSNQTRPDGWTSGDAAGLPIFPSIPRFDECERGMVEHALRFTVQTSRNTYVWPATHFASSNTSVDRPRMGERFRLKNSASVNTIINGMAKHPKAIALALQKYGMFMADNGGNWRISAGSDPRLTNLSQLTQFAGSDFEVVQPTGPNGGPRQYSTATVSITGGGGGGDTTAPAISISTPTTNAAYSTSATPLSLGGSASDNVGVSSVTWSNSVGGSGTAAGSTSWSASVALQSGSNAITVTAHDAAGNVSSDLITVTYTPADTTPPAITVTTPPASTTSSPLTVSGTSSDSGGVSSVTWTNAATGGSGTAAGTTSWSASIPLAAGSNAITITVHDSAGNTTNSSFNVTYTPVAGDTTPPTIAINSPTASTTWTATSTPLTVGGSAGDNVGVSTVTWSNAANGSSGSAGGTTSWNATVPLAAGSNTITIRAFDAAGNSATDTLTVDFSSGGGTPAQVKSGGGGGGACGLLGLEILALLLLRRRQGRVQ